MAASVKTSGLTPYGLRTVGFSQGSGFKGPIHNLVVEN